MECEGGSYGMHHTPAGGELHERIWSIQTGKNEIYGAESRIEMIMVERAIELCSHVVLALIEKEIVIGCWLYHLLAFGVFKAMWLGILLK